MSAFSHQDKVLSVRDLSVSFAREGQHIQAVKNLSLDVHAGETLAIVGESGSGKSVTSLALMRLVEQGGGTSTAAVYGSIAASSRRLILPSSLSGSCTGYGALIWR